MPIELRQALISYQDHRMPVAHSRSAELLKKAAQALVEALAAETPADMQVAITKAEPFGEGLKVERRELKNKLDVKVANANDDMKVLCKSENMKLIGDAYADCRRYSYQDCHVLSVCSKSRALQIVPVLQHVSHHCLQVQEV